jgi:DNA polymerase-1
MGDSSDNIPGVPKVGPKTAAKWISEYGNLRSVMEHADEIKGKVGEYLRESLEFLPMSYELATIKLDCDTGIDIEELKQQPGDPAELAAYYREFGFSRWYEEVESGEASEDNPPLPQANVDYECVLDSKMSITNACSTVKVSIGG